jgi:hypothetical protein
MNSVAKSGQNLLQSLEAKNLHALLQLYIPETPSIIEPPERLVDSSLGRETSPREPLKYLVSKNSQIVVLNTLYPPIRVSSTTY